MFISTEVDEVVLLAIQHVRDFLPGVGLHIAGDERAKTDGARTRELLAGAARVFESPRPPHVFGLDEAIALRTVLRTLPDACPVVYAAVSRQLDGIPAETVEAMLDQCIWRLSVLIGTACYRKEDGELAIK